MRGGKAGYFPTFDNLPHTVGARTVVIVVAIVSRPLPPRTNPRTKPRSKPCSEGTLT